MIGENLRKIGINVKYLLADEYKYFDNKFSGINYMARSSGITRIAIETFKYINSNKFNEIFYKNSPFFLLFYNPHPLNIFIAQLVKRKYPEAITCLYLHDPYKPDKSHYGKVYAIYFILVEFIQRLTVRYMDHAISPSEYSSQLFLKHYTQFKGESHIAPLIVPDQKKTEIKNRKLFSIIGTAHQATGHDTFVELVNFVAEMRLDYEFALISSSDVSGYLNMLSKEAQKILKVVNKNLITDSEINKILSESYAVFRLDKEVTQSGVTPVAYANDTPVIVRDIPGLTQHVRHKENGYIVSDACGSEELVNAMNYTKLNFHHMSRTARKSYEETWAEWNWDKYYDWLKNICNE